MKPKIWGERGSAHGLRLQVRLLEWSVTRKAPLGSTWTTFTVEMPPHPLPFDGLEGLSGEPPPVMSREGPSVPNALCSSATRN